MNVNLWTSPEHALDYVQCRADSIPHRQEAEAVLLELIPEQTLRVLDVGTGNGRLLALVKQKCPQADAVGIDFSPMMLELAARRFAGDASIRIVSHDLDFHLPALGKFDVIVSSFAIHHLVHERKRALYCELFNSLSGGGIFCNLEHVASPTQKLHEDFLASIGFTPETEDPSNKLLDVETQLGWLREIGFTDVDCLWKWRELALLSGRRAA